MKKILIFAALAAGMASCTSEEPVQVSDSYAIGFSTYVGKATRAGDVNTESLTSFAVYGGTEKTEFNGTEVTKQNGAWTYSPVQYWEKDAKYKFAAVAPAVSGASYDFASNKLTVANYSPADDDLIVASTNEITGKEADNSAVALNFKHALSKVQLTFNGGDLTKLSNVKLTSVVNKGNLGASYNNGVDPAWELAEGTGDYAYTIDSEAGNGVKYLLPQTLDAAAVTYTYDEKDHTILIKTADVAAWEMGKAYNYNISLDAGAAIAFEVSMAAWDTSINDQTIVEKEMATVTLASTGSFYIRGDGTNTTQHKTGETMEIKYNDSGRFFGFVSFTLPEDFSAGSVVSAELRLVTTQCKGDRNVNLYEFTGTQDLSNATYDSVGTECETIISDENNIIASFEANGKHTKSMGDKGIGTDYTDASKWTNLIDMKDFVNKKNAGSTFTILVSKTTSHNDALKFATEDVKDMTNSNVTGLDDSSTEKVTCTFAKEDLVPQLVITYTK